MPSNFQNDAIFWVEVDKINPNPYQPRRDFNEQRLRDLAESIRQYGVLQPLTVTRKEQIKDDGGLRVEYELIAGERRHRAAQMANLSQVPVIIRSGKEDSQVKLELAIIENLQREDLNPIERAEAFDQLANEFEFTHKQIAEKIGKSREYVSNSMRLLKLPEKIKQAIISGKMTEGHARPIMMLRDKPEQQEMLFKEVVHKGLTVREAESIARRDAQDKVRKKKNKIDPQTKALEDRLSDTFGTRVKIEERDVGGKLVIDFFSEKDLENIIKLLKAQGDVEMGDMMEEYVKSIVDDQQDEEAESQEESKSEAAGSELETSDSGDKSIAETLGTMIAAAKKQSEKESRPENETTDQEEEPDLRESDSEAVTSDAISSAASTEDMAEKEKEEEEGIQPPAKRNNPSQPAQDVQAETEVKSENDHTLQTEPTEVSTDEEGVVNSPNTPEDFEDSKTEEKQEAAADESEENLNSTEEEVESDESEDEMYAVSNFSI